MTHCVISYFFSITAALPSIVDSFCIGPRQSDFLTLYSDKKCPVSCFFLWCSRLGFFRLTYIVLFSSWKSTNSRLIRFLILKDLCLTVFGGKSHHFCKNECFLKIAWTYIFSERAQHQGWRHFLVILMHECSLMKYFSTKKVRTQQ